MPAPFLSIYLSDHHAAAQMGTRLARDISRLGIEPYIAAEIEEDARSLRRIMAQLGVDPSPVKDVLARVARRVARLKPNGRIVRRSPLSDLIELETLVVGITGKRALWMSLREAGAAPPEELDRLVARADDQLRRVEEARLSAARRALRRR